MEVHEIVRVAGDFDKRVMYIKNQKKGCDVTVIFNYERIPLHSIILAANSKYFENVLFNTPLVPKTVTLIDVDTEITKKILEYCYTGTMNLPQRDILRILKASHMLMIDNIVDSCCEILKSLLNSKNCFEIWSVARKLELDDLEDVAFDPVINNIEEIFKSRNFLQIDVEDFIKILESIQNTCSASMAFNSIKRWVNRDPKSRLKESSTLLGYVHLEHLSRNILLSESRNICDTDVDCLKLLNQVVSSPMKLCAFNTPTTPMVIGGYERAHTRHVEIYDDDNRKWIKRNLDINKVKFESVYYDNKIFTLGGYNRKPLATVESYNVQTWRKRPLATMRQSRWYFTAVATEGYIFAIGGYCNGSNLSSVERYNISKNTWTQIDRMPTKRSKHGSALINDEVYVIGGFGDTELNVNESYSISTEKWKARASMHERREYPAVASVNQFLYVVGGYNGSDFLKTVERFDPVLDKWSYVQSVPSTICSLSAVNFNGELIISGGETSIYRKVYCNTVMRYNPGKNQWSRFPFLNEKRSHHNMILLPKENLFE